MIFKEGVPVSTYKLKRPMYYESLGDAKTAAKTHIKSKNTKLEKPNKLHFDEYCIMEFELIEKNKHPL